jgi:4'-phosphopantetheinyl transferase
MPLLLEKTIQDAKKIGVWEITEPLDFFISQIQTDISDELSEKRKMEKAVSAFLLNRLFGSSIDEFMYKDEFGKPKIKNQLAKLSFSHSQNMIACIIDFKGEEVGIDIERKRESLSKIAHKFINESDCTPEKDELLNQHLIWGVKEVLYKVYGRKKLDFKKDLHVHCEPMFCGQVVKNQVNEIYSIDYQLINGFVLAWSVKLLSKNT